MKDPVLSVCLFEKSVNVGKKKFFFQNPFIFPHCVWWGKLTLPSTDLALMRKFFFWKVENECFDSQKHILRDKNQRYIVTYNPKLLTYVFGMNKFILLLESSSSREL